MSRVLAVVIPIVLLLGRRARSAPRARSRSACSSSPSVRADLRGRREGLLRANSGVEPELVYFQAAAPIATALAAGAAEVGATGLTAAL